MGRYIATIRSPSSAERAFDYMADLRNFEEWDPGVRSSTLVAGTSQGRRQRMT
ncbi:MAG: SRPBCC family protein [Thermoleophilia bacterium]|nr:SRPBCC family protein [Thermoleophilia bacterium]MDH3724827.1 SRPBCC family protein [Thermoleophilia bacterium]